MSQRVQVQLVDDLSGEEAQETVRFGLDGVEYEIDLTAEHASKLRSALSQYRARARKAPDGRKGGRSRRFGS